MSAYTTLRTRIVSTPHLRMALEDLGFSNVEIHDEPQSLEGFLGDTRSNRAHVIIRRKYLDWLSNDLGFRRRMDGSYEALISDYDRPRYDEQWLQKLSQRYAYHVAKEQLLEQGFHLVEETVEANKTIRLTLRKMA